MSAVSSARDSARLRLVEVATQLLADGGPAAVTTRSVALAAGVQAPAIYRLFGDKNGLLEAVVEHGLRTYLQQKPPVDPHEDPVADLRAGWDLHVGFGLANPAVFRLMHTSLPTPEGRRTAAAGVEILARRVHRIAEAGRLRVPEHRAVELIHAVGTGVVLSLIDRPKADDDTAVAELAWESVTATILTDATGTIDAPHHSGAEPAEPVTAAVTLIAALPGLDAFTDSERALLDEWLGRIANDRGPRGKA